MSTTPLIPCDQLRRERAVCVVARPVSRMRFPVSLRRLFPRASFVGCADIRVTEATERSGECRPRMLFAAVRGTRVDGADFIGDALERGAGSLLVERPLCDVSVPQCVVPNVRQAFAELCASLEGRPSRDLRLVGVTGTNGKTTVTWLVRSILRTAELRTGLLGTVEYDDGFDQQISSLTTPDAHTLSAWLSAMVRRGTTHAAIEASSHALDQHRLAGTDLDVAVVTNITQDHFDYHTGAAAYRASKARIVEHVKRHASIVLNLDDAGARSLMDDARLAGRVVTYALEQPADVRAVLLEESLAGSRFVLHAGGDSVEAVTPLIGRHNVSNCLAAAAAMLPLGMSLEQIVTGIAALDRVPGRLDRVDCGKPFDVFVDYAHTEDALRNAVGFLRRLARGRVICVFGAGGDRDRSKRPLMGRAAGEANLAVVTSDNPRSEDPQAIIEDILPGLEASGAAFHVEVDRAAAIRWALRTAREGDCVLVAGKGHECEQIVGTERIAFDDRDVVRRELLHGPHFLQMPMGIGA